MIQRRCARPHPTTKPLGHLSVVSLLGVVVSTLVFSATGCSRRPTAEAYPSEIETLATDRRKRDPVVVAQRQGRSVYEHYCAICHGTEGRGDGFNSSNLKVPPRNFADPEFWGQTTVERVAQAIRGGGETVEKSVLMPAWGRTLSKQQIADLVAFLPTLATPTPTQDEDPE